MQIGVLRTNDKLPKVTYSKGYKPCTTDHVNKCKLNKFSFKEWLIISKITRPSSGL